MLNKKGFISIYFLLILTVVSICCSYILAGLNQHLYFRKRLDTFRRLNNAEVLTIMRVKKAYKNFKEKDEILTYKNCIIDISIDGFKAYITISYHDSIREREAFYSMEYELFSIYK
jgi:uncharacterized protein YacL